MQPSSGCWCNDNYIARWKEIETYFEDFQIQSILGEKGIPSCIKGKINSITAGTFELWFKFVEQFKLWKGQKVLRWIAFDTQFKSGVGDVTFKQWTIKGIKAIGTVIDNKELQFPNIKR